MAVSTHQHEHAANEQFPMAAHFPPDINQRFFGALQIYPPGKVFEGLEPDEQVVMLIRRHWVTLLKPLAGGAALLLAPVIVLAVIFGLPVADFVRQYGLALAWFLFTFAVYYFVSTFLRYVADTWIVTTERIIDMDADTIGLKSATEVDLSAVAGASQVRGGGLILGGIDRGAVLVRIIGEEDDLLPDVPMSGPVAQVIGELAEAVQRQRGLSGSMVDRERQR